MVKFNLVGSTILLRRAAVVALFAAYVAWMHHVSSANADWDTRERAAVMPDAKMDEGESEVLWQRRRLLSRVGPEVLVCLHAECHASNAGSGSTDLPHKAVDALGRPVLSNCNNFSVAGADLSGADVVSVADDDSRPMLTARLFPTVVVVTASVRFVAASDSMRRAAAEKLRDDLIRRYIGSPRFTRLDTYVDVVVLPTTTYGRLHEVAASSFMPLLTVGIDTRDTSTPSAMRRVFNNGDGPILAILSGATGGAGGATCFAVCPACQSAVVES